MYENSPGSVGYYRLMEILYAHHPVRENVAGTVESIASITPETLYNCHKVFYNPSNMVLCCVGDVDPEAVIAAAERILPSEPGEQPDRDYGEPESPLPAERRSEREMEVAQPIFYMGVKLDAPKSGADRLRFRLLAELALDRLAGPSSGLYNDLYAQGLLSRDFGFEVDDAAGAMTMLIAGESRDPEAVADALFERIDRISRRGPDAAAFERCRRARYGMELGGLDRFSGYAGALFHGCMDGWNALDVFDLLQGFTAEEAAEFLCSAVTPERTAMSVIRPAG